MATDPKIGGYKTSLNISDIANPDESINITPEGDISQAVKNFPIRYYSASVFGRSTVTPASAYQIPEDSTEVQTVIMDQVLGVGNNVPTITFEANSLNDNIPEVTLYWMTTTTPQRTVFATCSGLNTNVLKNSPITWNMLWAPNASNYQIASVDFHPKKNYTEMALGGFFNDLGGSRLGNTNSYNNYGIINLTGGNSITEGGINFGPLGEVLSAIPANVGYAGGLHGLRGSATNGSTPIRVVKYISIPATVAPGATNTTAKSRNYLCLGGTFTSLVWSGSTIITQGLFIIDIDRPKTHFCRFDFGNNASVLTLDYDEDYQSLIICSGGTAFGNITMLSGLSSANVQSSYMGKILRASEGDIPLAQDSLYVETSSGSLGTVARLYLGYRDSLQGNSGDEVPLWRRFHFDSKFGQQAGTQFTNYAASVKYLKDVVYLGGQLTTTPAPKQSGVCALYCGEGRYGRDDGSYVPNNSRHSNIGKLVSTITNFSDLSSRWPSAISFTANSSSYTIVYELKIDKYGDKTYLYVVGSFKYFTNENGSLVYQADNKTLSRFIAAFDITDSLTNNTKPTVVSNWKPYPNSYVTSITTGFSGEGDQDVVYILGHFGTITTLKGVANRAGCCALTRPSENINVSVLNWTTNIGASASDINFRHKKLYNIPNTSPMSGLLITSPYAKKANNYVVNDIFRVSRYAQDIAPFQPQAIEWKIGPKILDGSDLAVPNTSFFTMSSIAGSEYIVNTTVFDTVSMQISTNGGMDGVTTGSLMRFLIQRPSRTLSPATSAQYYGGRAWVLGASVDQSHSS